MLRIIKYLFKRALCVHEFHRQKDFNGDTFLECRKCGKCKGQTDNPS